MLYANLAMIVLSQSFRPRTSSSAFFTDEGEEFIDAACLLLFCLGIVAGFFVFGFKFFGITLWSTLIMFLHSVFEAARQKTSFSVIFLEYLILAICATLKYVNEKAWRKNIIYNSAIRKSRDEREESTSILIPKIIVAAVMKQTLQSSNKLLSRRFKSATIFQSDIVGFTKISSALTAAQVVSLLHTLYEYYDQFTLECNVEKIETIGDAYICVNFTSSSSNVIEFALKVCDAHRQMQRFQVTEMAGNAPKSLEEALAEKENEVPVIDVDVRCGIASGNVAGTCSVHFIFCHVLGCFLVKRLYTYFALEMAVTLRVIHKLTLSLSLCLLFLSSGCVLGLAGLRFHLFGDALEHAITLEGASKTNRILVCNNTVKKNSNKFIKFEPHETLDAFYVEDTSRKILGDIATFWEDEKESLLQDCLAAMRASKSGEYDDEDDLYHETKEDPVVEEQPHDGRPTTARDVIVELEEEQKVSAADDGKMPEVETSRWAVLRQHVSTRQVIPEDYETKLLANDQV